MNLTSAHVDGGTVRDSKGSKKCAQSHPSPTGMPVFLREGVAAGHFYFEAIDPQDTKHLQSSTSSHVFESAVFNMFDEARLKIAHEGVNGWITGPLGWVAELAG